MAYEQFNVFQDELAQLKRKWNRLCQSLHQSKQPQNHWSNSLCGNHSSNAKIYPYNSSYPWWPNQSSVLPDSNSISFTEPAVAKPAHSSNLVPRFRRQQSCTIEFDFSEVTQRKQATDTTTTLDSLKGMEGKEVKITLALGNSTFGGSGQTVENITDRTLRRAHICKLLQENVPWQSETVPSIAEALVDSKPAKQCATWLFVQGNDSVGKTRMARAIAESVFGSVDDVLLHLDMRKMENSATPFSEMLAGSLKTNEKIVALIEDVDFADVGFKKFLADEFEAAKFGNLSRNDENSGQAIFMLTSGGTRGNNEENNKDSVMRLVLKVSETKSTLESSSPCLGHKRMAELDLFGKIKIPRLEVNKEEGVLLVSEQGNNRKKDFSRQSSFNTLDLNMKADEEDDDDGEEDKGGESSSPISSDLTRETMVDNLNSNGFLDSIENRFEFNQSPAREREKEEMFFSKIKGSFEEVCGNQNNMVKFTVEERVIEEIGVGCGSFTNSMFEKWLKDIFQSSLQTVNFDEKEGIVFTLCWGGKGDRKSDSGFMSSCLPKNIQVNYFMD